MDDVTSNTCHSQRKESRWLTPTGLFLFGMPAAFAVLSTVAYVVAAKRLPVLTEWTYESAKDRWAEFGPADYDMEIEIGGVMAGVVQIKVRGGKVVAMTRDGQTPRDERTWATWSVDGQFEMIDRELDIADDPVRELRVKKGASVKLLGNFEPHYGYPMGFQRLVTGADIPEVRWTTVRFEAKRHSKN